jgi:hypothetical protein
VTTCVAHVVAELMDVAEAREGSVVQQRRVFAARRHPGQAQRTGHVVASQGIQVDAHEAARAEDGGVQRDHGARGHQHQDAERDHPGEKRAARRGGRGGGHC